MAFNSTGLEDAKSSEFRILTNRGMMKDAIRNLLDLNRNPKRIRFMAMNIKNLEFEGFNLKNRLLKILKRDRVTPGTNLTISILVGGDISSMKFDSDLMQFYRSLNRFDQVIIKYHRKVHAKLLLIEDGSDNLVFVGSPNFTNSGFLNQIELALTSLNMQSDSFKSVRKFINRSLGNNATKLFENW